MKEFFIRRNYLLTRKSSCMTTRGVLPEPILSVVCPVQEGGVEVKGVTYPGRVLGGGTPVLVLGGGGGGEHPPPSSCKGPEARVYPILPFPPPPPLGTGQVTGLGTRDQKPVRKGSLLPHGCTDTAKTLRVPKKMRAVKICTHYECRRNCADGLKLSKYLVQEHQQQNKYRSQGAMLINVIYGISLISKRNVSSPETHVLKGLHQQDASDRCNEV